MECKLPPSEAPHSQPHCALAIPDTPRKFSCTSHLEHLHHFYDALRCSLLASSCVPRYLGAALWSVLHVVLVLGWFSLGIVGVIAGFLLAVSLDLVLLYLCSAVVSVLTFAVVVFGVVCGVVYAVWYLGCRIWYGVVLKVWWYYKNWRGARVPYETLESSDAHVVLEATSGGDGACEASGICGSKAASGVFKHNPNVEGESGDDGVSKPNVGGSESSSHGVSPLCSSCVVCPACLVACEEHAKRQAAAAAASDQGKIVLITKFYVKSVHSNWYPYWKSVLKSWLTEVVPKYNDATSI